MIMRAAAMIVGLGVVAALAVPAAADPSAAAPHRKNHETAKWLSGVGAGVSTALVVTSFGFVTPSDPFNKPLFYSGLATSVVSPSFGEFYTGQYLTYGEAVRAGAFGVAMLGVAQTETTSCTTSASTSCTNLSNTGVVLLGLAAIAYVGGALYDVYDAPDAVDRYNDKLRMQLSPGPMPSTLGPPGAGVWLRGEF